MCLSWKGCTNPVRDDTKQSKVIFADMDVKEFSRLICETKLFSHLRYLLVLTGSLSQNSLIFPRDSPQNMLHFRTVTALFGNIDQVQIPHDLALTVVL